MAAGINEWTTLKKGLLILLALLAAGVLAAFLASRPSPADYVYQSKSIQTWTTELASGDPTLRQGAKAAFQSLGRNAVPGLIQLLERHDSDLRKWVWSRASRLPPRSRQSFLSHVRPALADEVRLASAGALEILGPEASAARPALSRALRDEDPAVAHQAAISLARTGKDAIPLLVEALHERRAAVRRTAAFGLGELGPEAEPAIESLIKSLSDQDESVRLAASHSLSEIGSAAVPALVHTIEQDRGPARRGAAKALAWSYASKRKAVPPLMKMLQDEDPASRQQAIESLSALHATEPPVILAYTTALNDPVLQVRWSASEALRGLGSNVSQSLVADPPPTPK